MALATRRCDAASIPFYALTLISGNLAAMKSAILIMVSVLFLLALVARSDSGMCTSPPVEPDGDCGGDGGDNAHDSADVSEFTPFVIDITATIHQDLPTWDSPTGLGSAYRVTVKEMANGDNCNLSDLSFSAHTGTHIDMPSHFDQIKFESGVSSEKVDLTLLVGPVLVREVPAGTNITKEVLEKLLIPDGLEKLILKTDSTTKNLMGRVEFDSSYTAFTAEGARYLTESTSIKTIGIDYVSIARYEEVAEAHQELFKKDIMVVEGLVMTNVSEGWYTMTCLPLKVAGAEGVPARCILTNAPAAYYSGQGDIREDDLYIGSSGEYYEDF